MTVRNENIISTNKTI